MKIKGTAYLGRKTAMITAYGAERWEAFFSAFSKEHPCWKQPILASTLLEPAEFLALNDAIIEHFYKGDKNAYWDLGVKSAEWGFSQGPYAPLLSTKKYEQFVEKSGIIFGFYFTAGTAKAKVEGKTVTLELADIPPDCRHVYFEYLVGGFFERALELTGLTVTKVTAVKGYTKGDDSVLYTFEIDVN